MAATLKTHARVQWQDDNFSESVSWTWSSDNVGGTMYREKQTVPTSDTLLTFGIMTPMYFFIKNLDETNSVHIGPDSGGAIVEADIILAGETHGPFRMATTTWRAIAQNDSVDVLITAFPA